MMFLPRILTLMLFCGAVLGQPDAPVVGAKGGRLSSSLDAELPRDPTRMSGNFRHALKNMVPAQPNRTAAPESAKKLPVIELAGKLVCHRKPGTAVLRIDQRLIHITQGGTISLFHGGELVTLRVDAVTDDYVQLYLVEQRQTLTLR